MRIRELCGVAKGVDKRIDEGVLRWFNHVEETGKDAIAKRIYLEECVSSCSIALPRKGGLIP